MTIILGVQLNCRVENSLVFQKILSEYGCFIRTRLGLHKVNENTCETFGVILLEITEPYILPEIEKKLCSIDGIEIQKMVFS